MPVADPSFGWQEALVAYAIVGVVAFLVAWVATDLAHVSRTPYVAVLTLTALALTAGYLLWSGTSSTELVTSGWVLGVLAGLIAGTVVAPGVRRLPSGPRAEGPQFVGRLAWEGAVYGIAEAVLLATLPVLAVWQAADALGWTDGAWGKTTSGALAIVGALLVIAVHHLGYREFRGRAATKKLMGALVGCGVQALAFLFTGNVLAPVVTHIVLHWQLILRGVELPPASGHRLDDSERGSAAVDRGGAAGRAPRRIEVGIQTRRRADRLPAA